MLIFNGRVEGDLHGNPTCYIGLNASLIDYFAGSAGLLAQAAELTVLPPVPESTGHRPLRLVLKGGDTAAQQPGSSSTASNGGDGSDSFAPPPSFRPPLRIRPDSLPQFASILEQPATAAQLEELAAAADLDPLQAACQLDDLLYASAAAAFPPASSASSRRLPRCAASALRGRHQPWFDAECQAARQQLRQVMLSSLGPPGGQPKTHLAREALRVATNRYTQLRRRKAAGWQRRQGTALLHLQRSDPRTFFKRWKKQNPDNPIDAATWLRHFVNLQLKRTFKPSGPRPPAGLGPSDPPPPPDAELDADIAIADVEAAIGKLSPSSACLGPLKAALIKAGKPVLAPVLARLFTALFRAGVFPPAWALGAISPIHKKGDATDPNNYRGITVGHVLGKLYALTINTRLTAWLEEHGKRATGQAGFRKAHQTVDNCFILRALIERARARGVKLYTCAVDFEKAFDSVDRPQLWAALQRAGVGGCMLRAIQSMYADVPVCVKSPSSLSGCFQSVLGVKQGCPLSPLLFGVLLDDFEVLLQQALGDAAGLPRLAGRVVPPLLFADDMFLLSLSPTGLQAQLDYLQSYCDAKRLTVNAAKTQVMIFRPGGGSGGKVAAGDAFSYAGRPLEVVRSTKYLGLTFAQLSRQHGFSSSADVLATAGRQALFAMRRRASELGVCLPEQQGMLFDIFVKPVLSYGCEVWGVDLLSRADCSSERVHRWFCRRVQGLPKQASSAVCLAELGRWPLHLHWVQQLARFWNRLLSMDTEPDRLLRWAFQDNLSLMREGADLAAGSPCWCRKWFQFLQSSPTDSGTLVWLTPLREGDLLERATKAYLQQAMSPATKSIPTPTRQRLGPPAAAAVTPSPSSAPSTRSSKFSYYLTHIRGQQPLGEPAPHLLAVSDARHRTSLSRFRASCHHLRIERERYLPEAIKAPRHNRTCLVCASESVEDESHHIFHCPLTENLRWQFADLFDPHLPQSTSSFLSQDQVRIAAFIHECSVLRCRNSV